MNRAIGINGFSDWRFSVTLSLHLLACLLFAETGSIGPFHWAQFAFSGMIAFVLVSTLCWQWRVFGDPKVKANIVLHLSFILSSMFCIDRLFVKGADRSVLDQVVANFKWFSQSMISWIPDVVFDILTSPGAALLLVAVSLALSMNRKWGIGAILTVLMIAFGLSAGRPGFGDPLTFIGGLISIGVALSLQRDDFTRRHFWLSVVKSFKSDLALKADLEIKIRLLEKMHDLNRPMQSDECIGVVSRACGLALNDPKAIALTKRITTNLVYQDHLASVVHGPNGSGLALKNDFTDTVPDAFTVAAGFPKAVIILLLAIVWIISPLDLIPDYIPLFGALDDVAMGLIASSNIGHLINASRDREGGAGLSSFDLVSKPNPAEPS